MVAMPLLLVEINILHSPGLLILPHDHLHPPDRPARQAHLDPVRMSGRGGQDLLDDAPGPLAGRLVLLEDDLDGESGADVLSARSVHGPGFSSVRSLRASSPGTRCRRACLFDR